jgi:hypothetical protein
MSVDIAYVQRSVDAAARLALRDTQAMESFDLTVDGYFRSFAAMIVALPLYVGLNYGWETIVITYAKAIGDQHTAALSFDVSDFALYTLDYLLSWLAFPVVMVFVLRFLGLTARYSALVIAYNWGTIIVFLLDVPAVALFGLGVISAFQALALQLIIFGFGLYYRFFVAMTALQSKPSVALAVALIDFITLSFLGLGLGALGGLLNT